jgi:hypothetical protein
VTLLDRGGLARFDDSGLWASTPALPAGARPGDGIFVPVSAVCLLTRPNRMTVSPGPRRKSHRMPALRAYPGWKDALSRAAASPQRSSAVVRNLFIAQARR